jgi:dihydroorotase/N-acyl-D-amino-acid deacylase
MFVAPAPRTRAAAMPSIARPRAGIRAAAPTVALLALAACRAGTTASPAPADAPYDLVIENGRVVDGTGNAWYHGDVAVRGDRVVAVVPRGMLRRAGAARRVDATGLVVAPGFIDIQGHSGNNLLFGDGRLVSKVTQGVTTEILGEGSTPAPTTAAMQGDLATSSPEQRATLASLRGPRGFDAWLRAMERRGVSVNVGAFVGAGTLREYGMGMAMGVAGAAALDSMRAALARAMEDGALGLGSALIYPPGNFAGTAELVAVSRAMAPYGGVYITHLRSEADGILDAMDEAIRIGREAGVPVEIFHLKPAGQANWSKWPAVVAKIDSARRAGLDVQATMYPYTAGATGLTSCLPPWTSADGRLFDNLADSAVRARIRAEVARETKEWEDLCAQATPAGVLVSDLRTPALRPYAGKRLSEIAAAMGRTPLDAAMDLILGERRRVETTYFLMSEENVRRNLQQPWMKIGTDAGGLDPDSTRTLTHPRAFGTYPRILGRYVRDEGALTLEEAVRKMTSAVATRLSLADRGQLRPGGFADITVFDPATIADRATYEQPLQLSVGVRHVWVNGVQVLQDGRHTGATPGRAVRGAGWRAPR